jgi:hypothetical protein
MGIWEGLKRGTKALLQGEGPVSFQAGGQKVSCPHCKSEAFYEGRALLNTFGMTFLNLDWANKGATTLMCDQCGLIQWFGIEPERLEAVKPQLEDVAEF